MRKELITLIDSPSISASASVAGCREHDGPLGELFDFHDPSDKFAQDTWEKSEGEMQRLALGFAMSKNKLGDGDIDVMFAGDLINQCTSSIYGLLDFDIPYFGIYGACSTVAEGLTLASMAVGFDIYARAAVITSSHNCSAERQFRFPLEYGGQRSPTSQWTVTASGAFIVEKNCKPPFITEVMPGRVLDKGISDAGNMGAAMAPAATDTLLRYFRLTGHQPSDFDMIFTGDLGYEGHRITSELCKAEGFDISGNYQDCGLIIYDIEGQDMHAGGSGCGCGASVLSAYILKKMLDGSYHDILFLATGALMSPMSVQQGLNIPGIAHLLHISDRKYEKRV